MIKIIIMIHPKVTGGVLCVVHFAITGIAKAVAEANTSIAINTHSEIVWHLDLIQDRG